MDMGQRRQQGQCLGAIRHRENSLPSVSVIGGTRTRAASWTDAQGNFWLFGGSGIDSVGAQGYLGDMWMISPLTGQPIWYGGANTVNSTGSTATPNAVPGARAFAITWTDHNGFLWLFGGQTVNSAGTAVTYNDLWKFDPVAFQWTLVSGSATPANARGTYGTQGAGSISNFPGARLGASAWTDTSGKLWLFGGSGYDLPRSARQGCSTTCGRSTRPTDNGLGSPGRRQPGRPVYTMWSEWPQRPLHAQLARGCRRLGRIRQPAGCGYSAVAALTLPVSARPATAVAN